MDTDARFRELREGTHQLQQQEAEEEQEQEQEQEETLSFGVSPVRHVDLNIIESEGPSIIRSPIQGMSGSRSTSSNSSASSSSSLAITASSELSESDEDARHSSRRFGEGSPALGLPAHLLQLDASISRKQGWLPFPPAKPANKNDSSDLPIAYYNRASQAGIIDGPKLSSNSSPTDSMSLPGTKPTPRTKTYEVKVNKLYYKLPPPKQTALTKLKRLFSRRTVKVDDDYETNGKYILRNISFEAKAGEVLGIAGSSGAGKSTILECLAGRVKPSSPPGCILVNNQIMNGSTFRRISGYVMQDDALFPTLTVLETLLISARLRLPSSMSMEEKRQRVQGLLEELGLQHAANTRIGNDMIRGVSGGERRRVSIGIDVIHDPAVLILDEPTSGLDSAAALNVIAMLRAMAESRGRTVVLSIHQPSFRILQLMHSVLLVAGGMVVHHGSLEHLAARLASAGHEVPARTTVLEYAIDAVNSWETEDSYAAVAKRLRQQQVFAFEKDNLERGETKSVDVESGRSTTSQDFSPNGSSPGDDGYDDKIKFSYANNIFQETAVLTERFFKNILRTKELFGARSIQALLAGTILGTVFLNVDSDRQGVADRLGFFVFTLTFLLNSTTEALPIFLQERQILLRETSRGAYRIASYVLSHTVVFVPFLFAIAILYGAPSYWLTGLTSSIGCFLFYCLVLWLTLLLANSFVALFSALVPNYIMGQALVAAFMGAFFLFSGYIINRNNIPKYWIWMHYISLFKYPFDALLLNEFGVHKTLCYDRLSSNDALGIGGAGICTLTGSQVLSNSGVQGRQKWMDVAAMVGFIIFYRLSCYVAVRWRLTLRQR